MLTHFMARAGDRRFIPGVYNYCDQWCAHCPATGRCLVFATLQEQPARSAGPGEESAGRAAGQAPQDFELADADGRPAVPDVHGTPGPAEDGVAVEWWLPGEGHPLEFLARHYTRQADGCLASLAFTPPPARPPSPVDVISWFALLIPAKIHRALFSQREASIDVPGSLGDALGTAKVVLIGIDRSLAAWQDVAGSTSDARIGGLMELLEALRTGLEIRFPDARAFVRPGLDDERVGRFG